MGMKIIILGQSGFIGGHVSKYLGDLGYEIDHLSKTEFMSEDFRRLDDWKLEGEGKPDILINCAWIRGDLHKTDHLEMAHQVCYLYQECANRGIRVLNLGSSSEYGVKEEPMREDMICEPINTYGIAKLSVTLFAKNLGFNTLRLFTVTGEGGHSFMNIYDKTNKWSGSNFERTYIHIREVCQAIERIIHAKHLYGEIINIGRENITNYEVISDDYNMEYCDKAFNNYPQSQYEPVKWEADTTKMKRLLNI